MEKNQVTTVIAWMITFLECIALPLTICFHGNSSFPYWYNDLCVYMFIPKYTLAIVWIFCYLVMGISSFLIIFVYIKRNNEKTIDKSTIQRRTIEAILTYILNLILFSMWWPTFFDNSNFVLASILATIQLIVIIFMLITFWRIHWAISIINFPYLGWMTFLTGISYLTWFDVDVANRFLDCL